jgi:hypothetical protein
MRRLAPWWASLSNQVSRLARFPRLGALLWITLVLAIGVLLFALGGLIGSGFSCHLAQDLSATPPQCRTPTALSIGVHLAIAFAGVGVLVASIRLLRKHRASVT